MQNKTPWAEIFHHSLDLVLYAGMFVVGMILGIFMSLAGSLDQAMDRIESLATTSASVIIVR